MGDRLDMPPEGYKYVYTAYVTLKNGTKLYASQFGKKAFRILVKD